MPATLLFLGLLIFNKAYAIHELCGQYDTYYQYPYICESLLIPMWSQPYDSDIHQGTMMPGMRTTLGTAAQM